jgi:hypothetical protein
MQMLWAKILAGEANSPGTFSKRTVNFLSSLDKTDAQLFTKLCGFVWNIEKEIPLIFNREDSIYKDNNINFDTLNHLDDIGLITFEGIASYESTELPKNCVFCYYGTPVNIEFKNPENNEIETGLVLLTKVGQQLVKICGSKPIDGFFKYVIEKWAEEGLILSSPLQEKR